MQGLWLGVIDAVGDGTGGRLSATLTAPTLTPQLTSRAYLVTQVSAALSAVVAADEFGTIRVQGPARHEEGASDWADEKMLGIRCSLGHAEWTTLDGQDPAVPLREGGWLTPFGTSVAQFNVLLRIDNPGVGVTLTLTAGGYFVDLSGEKADMELNQTLFGPRPYTPPPYRR